MSPVGPVHNVIGASGKFSSSEGLVTLPTMLSWGLQTHYKGRHNMTFSSCHHARFGFDLSNSIFYTGVSQQSLGRALQAPILDGPLYLRANLGMCPELMSPSPHSFEACPFGWCQLVLGIHLCTGGCCLRLRGVSGEDASAGERCEGTIPWMPWNHSLEMDGTIHFQEFDGLGCRTKLGACFLVPSWLPHFKVKRVISRKQPAKPILTSPKQTLYHVCTPRVSM